MFRSRECNCPPGGDASNPDCGCDNLEECETCKGEPLCEWTEWAEPKTPCSVTCGTGTQPKDRECNKKRLNPEEDIQTCPKDHIDEGCPGSFTEQSPCAIDACPPPKCEYTPWTPWCGCSATCGGGKTTRTRDCECPEDVPKSECMNNGQCDGEPREEKDCNTDIVCPPECEYSPDWEPWSPCTKTCGGGTASRSKKCECKNDDNCGECEGVPPNDFTDCNTEPCTCWGDWQPWSECPDSCGNSERERVRECICDDCDTEGDRIETEMCEGDMCQWSCWSDWGECIGGIDDDGVESDIGPPCGESIQERTRECDCPPGADEIECGCVGEPKEETVCDLGPCDSKY